MPTINRCGGGGSEAKLNVYAQPNLPTDKFDGILLQTAAAVSPKKLVVDPDVWVSGTWRTNNGLPDYPLSGYGYMGRAVVDNVLYSFGGSKGASVAPSAYKFTPATNTWTQIASVPFTGAEIACAVWDGEIYLFGGYYNSTVIQACYKYTPSTNTYTALTSLPAARYGAAVDFVDGTAYLFCGANASTALNTCLKYVVATNTFSSIASFPAGTTYLSCVAYNGMLYIAVTSTYLYKYDPGADAYTTISSGTPPMNGSLGFLVGSKIYFLSLSNTNFISFDPTTNTITALASTPATRQYPAGGVLPKGIYLFGGNGSTTADLYLFVSKIYPDEPTAVIFRPDDKASRPYGATMFSNKLCDALPLDFKDVMLYTGGALTFPALYVGDGTQWTLKREAQ